MLVIFIPKRKEGVNISNALPKLYDFSILDVAENILGLRQVRTTSGGRVHIYECPFCSQAGRTTPGKLYIREGDYFNCFSCGTSSRYPVMLYSMYYDMDTKKAYRELVDICHGGEKRARRHVPAPVVKIVPEEPLASIEVRSTVYTNLLDILGLEPTHLKDLKNRGLPEVVIQDNMYKSYPVNAQRRWAICKHLAQRHDLQGVPGFFINKSGNWDFAGYPKGILIPVRDIEGNIQGLQLRIHPFVKKKGSSKYLWISSLGKNKGAGACAFVHYTYPKDAPGDSAWWLTEGALKADIARFFLNEPFVAVPGVTSVYKLMPELKKHGITKMVNAYDMDRNTNEKVAEALDKLSNELTAEKITVKNATWQVEDGKGIDDACKVLAEENLALSTGDFVNVKRTITYERITIEEELQYQKKACDAESNVIDITPDVKAEKKTSMWGFFRKLINK